MDLHDFDNLQMKVREAVKGDAESLLDILRPLSSLTVEQQLTLVDICLESKDTRRTLSLFSEVIYDDNDLARIARMVTGRLIERSVEDLLELINSASVENRSAAASFVASIIDSIPVSDLIKDSSVSVVKELLKELVLVPEESVKNKLIEFVTTENRALQVEAVKLLGSTATPFAVEVLIDSIDTDEALGILIVNQLSKVKNKHAVKGLLALLAMNNVKIRSFVEKKIEQIGASLLGDLHRVVEDEKSSTNLLVSVLGVLTKLHDPSSLKSVKRLVAYFHDNANVRACAYVALAAINIQSGAPLLVDALRDPVDDVAFAAARALEKGCNSYIKDGVRNVILSSVYPVERLVEVLLFTCSDEILRSLTDLPEVVSALNSICHYVGMEHYRTKYKPHITVPAPDASAVSGRGLVWAIDDAPSVLNMYERFCIKNGLPFKLYENAQEALLEMPDVKPDLIFVDLNMPDLDGISFTKEVRARFTKEELPIVLVTTQEGVSDDGSFNRDDFWDVIYKPFNDEALRGVQESIFSSLVY